MKTADLFCAALSFAGALFVLAGLGILPMYPLPGMLAGLNQAGLGSAMLITSGAFHALVSGSLHGLFWSCVAALVAFGA